MPKKPQITLLQKLALNIRYSKDKKVIIACSGGSDSMVLLELFRTHELPSSGIIVCHINHELRESATRDENIVREYCNKYDITSEFLSLDVKKGAKEAKETLEEYARNIRREWLEKMRKKHKADIIATAHHADDQAETILYRITKWTGITGLVGIEECTWNYYRPLLHLTKKEILEYTKDNATPFGHDEENLCFFLKLWFS